MNNTEKPLPVPDVHVGQAVFTVEEWQQIQKHITDRDAAVVRYVADIHELTATIDAQRIDHGKTEHVLLIGTAQNTLMRLALVTIAHGPFPEGMRGFAARELERVKALKLPQCAANWTGDPPTDCNAPFCGCNPLWDETMQLLEEAGAVLKYPGRDPVPVPMILHCPHCHTQHVDREDEATHWSNPPHKSHLCAACGHIWRPADVPTMGVQFIKTVGEKDTVAFVEMGGAVIVMLLQEWADRWGVPMRALDELLGTVLDHASHNSAGDPPLSEAGVQSRVRLEGANKGIYLWRNNVGAGTLDNGSFIRWGLANDSPQLNEKIKSGDLIGVRSIVIQPHHIGRTIGQFVSREVKREAWSWRGTEEEQAQLRWAALINRNGGDAKITNKVGTL